MLLAIWFLQALPAPLANAFGGSADEGQNGVLELFVNEVDKGTILVHLRGKDIFVAVSGLDHAGVKWPAGQAITIGDASFVPLAALAPAISYQYDDAQLVLRLSANPRALAGNTLDLATTTRPDDLIYGSSNSAFVNYAFGASTPRSAYGFSEQGINLGNALFDNSVSYFHGRGYTRTGTALIFDDRGSLTRLTLGDSLVNGGLLTGSADIMGVDYARNFTLDPYLITYPLQTMSGNVTLPSTAYVYVNGQLLRTIQLQPGPFSLQNVQVGSGSSNTRVVISNAYGQQQVLQAPFYLGFNQLRQGISQFNFALGVARAPDYRGFADYRSLTGLAFYRYGFNDWVTGSLFSAMEASNVTAGAEVAVSLPYVGRIGLDGAQSGGHGTHGWAGAVQYSYQSQAFSLGADYQLASDSYAALALAPAADRTSRRYDVSAGTSVKGLGISVSYTNLDDRDFGPQSQFDVQLTHSIGGRLQASLIFSRSTLPGAAAQDTGLLLLTVPLGPRDTVNASVQRAAGVSTASEQYQHALPSGTGLGYAFQLQQGADSLQNAALTYQAPYGLAQFNALRSGAQTTEIGNVSGALVYIGGQTFATRAVQDSFALVKAPGVNGAEIDVSNNPVVKTDAHGQALVPNLLPYYGNQISIEPNSVPINYDIQSTELDVAPPYRGGLIVRFPLRLIQAVEGRLAVLAQGAPVGAAGDVLTVTAGGQSYTSPLGTDGAFYFENLPPGRYPATLAYAGGVCRFEMAVPASDALVVRLGRLTCGS